MVRGGRKGRAYVTLAAGQRLTLAHEPAGPGCVRRIWATISQCDNPIMLRVLRLDFFWDGATTPAVSAPLGDFFGHSLGRISAYSSALFSSPEGRSFCCFVPMPFRDGMRLTVTNESNRDLEAFYYDVDYTTGDRHEDDVCYLHAHFRRENTTRYQHDFSVLPHVYGRGRYLGATMGVRCNTQKYGPIGFNEGEFKVFLDGDSDYPSLCGTGAEDYVGTGWGLGRFASLYHGCPISDEQNWQFSFYRYHLPDPVVFHSALRVVSQQIGSFSSPAHKKMFREMGAAIYAATPAMQVLDFSTDEATPESGLYEREDDWSACAYFYLDRPENDLPTLPPVAERIADVLTP